MAEAGKKRAAKTPEKTSMGLPAAAGDFPKWQETVGMYIAGQAEIDEADKVAVEMERKWGVDRLRLVVDAGLREKFDRQRYLFNRAIWHGDLEEVRREAKRMIAAWRALDRVAGEAQAEPRPEDVWEVAVGRGVAAIVRREEDARHVIAQGRHVAVYTLPEVGRLLAQFPTLAAAKEVFPGAEVKGARRPDPDPLYAIPDSRAPLDDTIPL